MQLVEELLQLARIESGAPIEMASVDLEKVLAECVERFQPQAERAAIALASELRGPVPELRANAAHLGQAIGNLVHNALKFTPAGGWVAGASAEVSGTDLLLRVEDSGTGIEPADLSRICERFYVADRSRTARGTGLSLAIVKHVALAHGGTVHAEKRARPRLDIYASCFR